ncbi:hypothetical protein BJY59DRAFT_112905 [Rhodotorula toruloides]
MLPPPPSATKGRDPWPWRGAPLFPLTPVTERCVQLTRVEENERGLTSSWPGQPARFERQHPLTRAIFELRDPKRAKCRRTARRSQLFVGESRFEVELSRPVGYPVSSRPHRSTSFRSLRPCPPASSALRSSPFRCTHFRIIFASPMSYASQ